MSDGNGDWKQRSITLAHGWVGVGESGLRDTATPVVALTSSRAGAQWRCCHRAIPFTNTPSHARLDVRECREEIFVTPEAQTSS